MKNIDAKNAVLGRIASYAAKQALGGEKVSIFNAEKAIVVGNKKEVMNKFREKRKRHGSSQKGPKYPTTAHGIIKRTIRGMLPHKKERGKKALKRIKCYDKVPKEFKDKKLIKSGKGKTGIKLKTISERLR